MVYFQPTPVTFVTAPAGTYYNAEPVILVGANGQPIDLSGGGGTPSVIDGGTASTS